jgi:hypothetical protein
MKDVNLEDSIEMEDSDENQSIRQDRAQAYFKYSARILPNSQGIILIIVIVLSWLLHVKSTKESDAREKLEEEKVLEAKRIVREDKVKTLASIAAERASFNFDDDSKPLLLVVYVYSERPDARDNAVFFIQHGLHSKAHFLFILNGETDLDQLLPKAPNILIVRRDNTCYDLGAIGEVLRSNSQELLNKFKRFIFMNASIRGPFIPTWAKGCWSDMFLNKITEKVKLVGTTYNCWHFHIQSMIIATDLIGVKILLAGNITDTTSETDPKYINDWGNPESLVGLTGCYSTKFRAVSAEISLTNLIKKAGYNISVLMTSVTSDQNYDLHCDRENKYNLGSVHPYEVIFIKAREGWENNMDKQLLNKMTEWHNTWNYNSWEECAKF